jgi:hypothetical protein
MPVATLAVLAMLLGLQLWWLAEAFKAAAGSWARGSGPGRTSVGSVTVLAPPRNRCRKPWEGPMVLTLVVLAVLVCPLSELCCQVRCSLRR